MFDLNKSHMDTRCVQAGWQPKSGEPRVLPIYQSTTFKYDSVDTLGQLFDLEISGDFYTRLGNPTLSAVESKITALEGGVGAMLTSAGQAASMISVLTIGRCGRPCCQRSRHLRRDVQSVQQDPARMGH